MATEKIRAELQSLSPSAMIILYQLDLAPEENPGESVLYFHAGTNELREPVVFAGKTYQPFPLSVTGYAQTVQGATPRLKVYLSNEASFMSSVILDFEEMLGARLTRLRTFARYLDAVNFTNGNPEADPSQVFPPDVYYMEQKLAESRTHIEAVFSSKIDMEGAKAPKRMLTCDCCPWVYRKDNCPYTGKPVADSLDNLLSDHNVAPKIKSAPYPVYAATTAYTPGDVVSYQGSHLIYVCIQGCTGKAPYGNPSYWFKDRCSQRFSGCRLRYPGARDVLPIGCFPGMIHQ